MKDNSVNQELITKLTTATTMKTMKRYYQIIDRMNRKFAYR